MNNEISYFDNKLISSVSGYPISANVLSDEIYTGLHKSVATGSNVEFSEFRQYTPGDDIKNIDWKAYARKDKFYIKIFEEETNLKTFLLLDHSKSMSYKSNDKFYSKLEYAKFLAATIGYKIVMQQDSFGVITFNNKITNFIKPAANHSNLTQLDNILKNLVSSGQSDFKIILEELTKIISGKSLIIIFSDFIDNFLTEKELSTLLVKIKTNANQVKCVQINDINEIELNYDIPCKFIDLENNSNKINIEPDKIRKRYKELMFERSTNFKVHLNKAGIKYYNFHTERNLIDNLKILIGR